MTREGYSPWCRVVDHLIKVRIFCRRELKATTLNEVLNIDGPVWNDGPSKVSWDLNGLDPPPSTWDTLDAAAGQDIEWLTNWLKEYQSSLSEQYSKIPLPIEFEDANSE